MDYYVCRYSYDRRNMDVPSPWYTFSQTALLRGYHYDVEKLDSNIDGAKLYYSITPDDGSIHSISKKPFANHTKGFLPNR